MCTSPELMVLNEWKKLVFEGQKKVKIDLHGEGEGIV